jgi:hypothetical protein
MSKFRKWLVAGVLSLSTLFPLAAVTQAQAAPAPEFHGHVYHHWLTVFYRSNCNAPWIRYGSYHNRFQADHAMHHLQHDGFEAYVQ